MVRGLGGISFGSRSFLIRFAEGDFLRRAACKREELGLRTNLRETSEYGHTSAPFLR